MSSKEVTVSEPAEPAESEQSQSREELPDATPTEERAAAELSLDVIFEVLKNQRRRYVLRYLKDRQETVALGELAEHVAAQENDKSVDAITSDERKRVYVGLYQCHLPKMNDMGIVDFNRDRGRVTLTETAEQLDTYLDNPTAKRSPNWYRLYGGLSAVGIVAVGAIQLGVAPVAGAPALTLGAVIIAFAACSFAHVLVDSGLLVRR